jgi:hypothetical protein
MLGAGGASSTPSQPPPPAASSYRGLPLPPGSPPNSDVHEHLVLQEASGFRLFVGDIQASLDQAQLTANGVTCIINCCAASCGRSPADWAPFPARARYAMIFSDDSFWSLGDEITAEQQRAIDAQDPSSQWHAAMLLLEECRAAGGSALIHCHWCVRVAPFSAARPGCQCPSLLTPSSPPPPCAPAGALTAPSPLPPSSWPRLAPRPPLRRQCAPFRGCGRRRGRCRSTWPGARPTAPMGSSASDWSPAVSQFQYLRERFYTYFPAASA